MEMDLIQKVNENYQHLQDEAELQALFDMANRPGIEKRKRAEAKARQEEAWEEFKDALFNCMLTLSIVLLVCNLIMLGAILWALWA